MDSLKSLITEQDTWTNAEGENEGTPFLLRYRPFLKDFISTNRYTKRLMFSWQYNSEHPSLMPSDKELELMGNVENALVDSLEKDVQSVLAFSYTGQNKKEWHWYSSDLDEAEIRFNKALSKFGHFPIAIASEDDPDWNEYNAVLAGAV
jgi:hypothetical protein